MIILGFILFGVTLVLSMLGKGGGEFFVPIFLAAGIPYQQAASASLFILMVSGLIMMLVFHKKTLIDWNVGLILILSVASGSFFGGFISASINEVVLKITFSVLLIISAFFIARPKKRSIVNFGIKIKRKCCGESYEIPILIIIPIVFVIGFIAGMVGISGGGLIVPLLIIIGNMPMRISFATNSLMVLFSATTGFIGRGISTDINWKFNIVMALFAAIGSLIGSHFSTKVKIENLKKIFVFVLVFASVWMFVKTLVG
ncbi:hypothetical protein HNP65_001820 [Thermosipho japonicus]|uniref:Probable membrane transporter protein n=1 Tax=Thermosipho japonicus TaxID=90323 RepID=A0A841GUQ0_9BACT|nr:sulfite exporter TauE/SafE family protein [Thermosipho japonicus]MBB6063350.1 hypothetical protein [Thermosipho japonicus]